MMMTITCPNCGKPLRPGTKFCGNCGSLITSVSPSKSATTPERALSAAQPGSGLCPHCGKPLRKGAKFCNNCGKQVPEGAQVSVTSPEVPQSAIPMVGVKPMTPSPGPIARSAPTTAPERRPARKRVWTWLLISLLSIVCVIVLAGVYIFRKDPLGWFGKTKLTPAASEIAITEPVGTPETGGVISTTATIVPSDTTIPPETATPSDVYPTPLETLTVAPLTSTITITTSVTSLPRAILFEDNFDGDINSRWNPWGKATFYPTIKRGPEGGWLSLIASESSSSAGVTSKSEIKSSAGVEIEFEAQLNPNYPQFPMIFDWDPLNNPRSANSKNPGVVHFEINTDKLVLKTPNNQQSVCIRPINGAAKHKYFIKFTENQGITMMVEGNPVEPCSIPDIGQPPMKGRLTISGMGWVMYMKVTTP